MVYSNSYSHRLYPSYDSGMTHMWGNLRSSGIWKPLLGRWSCKYTITVYHAGVWLVLGYIFFFTCLCLYSVLYLFIYIYYTYIYIHPPIHPTWVCLYFQDLRLVISLRTAASWPRKAAEFWQNCRCQWQYIVMYDIIIYIPTGTVCCPDPQLWC